MITRKCLFPFKASSDLVESHYREYRGFSLVELLLVIGLVSVLSFVGLPYLAQMHVKSQVQNQITLLVTLLKSAKSEAIHSQRKVIVCPTNTTQMQRQCSKNWNESVIAFIDTDNNGRYSINDKLLSVIERSPIPMEVNRTKFQFLPTSHAATTAGRLKLCPEKDKLYLAQSIVISNVGRIRVVNAIGDTDCQ